MLGTQSGTLGRTFLNALQDLRFAPALFLNPPGVAVKDFEHRQGSAGGGKFAGHMESGRHGHHGMEADIIFAPEGAGIGQSAGSHKASQLAPGLQFFGQTRQELLRRSFLHEAHERFE